MNRRIITAMAGISLFGVVAMAQASAPVASNLKPASDLHVEASAATPERVAYIGFPNTNVATTTNVGLAGIAIGTSGSVAQSSVAQAGGLGNVGLAASSARSAYGGRGGGRTGFGGWRRVAVNDAPIADRADILFDN